MNWATAHLNISWVTIQSLYRDTRAGLAWEEAKIVL